MMRTFLHSIAFICIVLALASCGTAKIVSQSQAISSQFEVTGLSKTGAVIVEVISVSPTANVSDAELRRDLLYNALFTGIVGRKDDRIKDLVPLVPDVSSKEKYQEQLSRMIGAEYNAPGYVSRFQDSTPVIVRTSNAYTIKEIFVLDSERLRNDFEKQNIIKSLSNYNSSLIL